MSDNKEHDEKIIIDNNMRVQQRKVIGIYLQAAEQDKSMIAFLGAIKQEIEMGLKKIQDQENN